MPTKFPVCLIYMSKVLPMDEQGFAYGWTSQDGQQMKKKSRTWKIIKAIFLLIDLNILVYISWNLEWKLSQDDTVT